MTFHLLRIELDDTPGALGEVARALGSAGVNIVDLDVHSAPGVGRVDEVTAHLSVPLDVGAIERVVRGAGGNLAHVSPIDEHEMRDRATAALELAAWFSEGGDDLRDRLAEAARRLVRAELVWVSDGLEPGERPEIVRRVLDARSPAQVQAPVKRLPCAPSTWWLGVPIELTTGDVGVLVLIRRGPVFTFTETARVQALVRIAASGARSPHGHVVPLSDNGSVTLRELAATDFDALIRLHRRCSTTSVHRRYFSALPSPPDHILRRLVDLDGSSRVGVAATLGSELVGVAHAFQGPDGVELAFLVEDAHQRRGIGGALLEELSARLVRRGVQEAHALTLPDNVAMRRLMARIEDRATAWDGDIVRITARFPASGAEVVVRS